MVVECWGEQAFSCKATPLGKISMGSSGKGASIFTQVWRDYFHRQGVSGLQVLKAF